ncbi:MAG TPA: HAMP domain-containing sensor histidine kinase [Acidimicrobiia bacterium]
MITFALGGLAVIAVLSLVTYFLSQRYLLDQRERAGTRQTFLDARFMRDHLDGSPAVARAALEALPLTTGAAAVVVAPNGEWRATSAALQPRDLPSELTRIVRHGDAAHQRLSSGGHPRLVVGTPIATSAGVYSYYEIVPLAELQSTLRVVRNSLLAAAALATIAAALLGRSLAQRALRPLVNVSSATERIAAGDFSARLGRQADPDLDRVASSFNSMAGALQTRIDRDERFVGDVTHELRSPLTTLSASADVLRSRMSELPERAQIATTLVVAEIDRLCHMVEELLELSRIEVGADPLRLEAVRVSELALQAAARIEAHPFTVELAPEVVDELVLVDKRRFERILVNILDNAERHGGGVVSIRAYRSDGRVRLEVDDEGPGVPFDDRLLIFERFSRGAKAGRRGAAGGTGLGLALVAEHARTHGGSVWVEDRPGQPGARFVVDLPWQPA